VPGEGRAGVGYFRANFLLLAPRCASARYCRTPPTDPYADVSVRECGCVGATQSSAASCQPVEHTHAPAPSRPLSAAKLSESVKRVFGASATVNILHQERCACVRARAVARVVCGVRACVRACMVVVCVGGLQPWPCRCPRKWAERRTLAPSCPLWLATAVCHGHSDHYAPRTRHARTCAVARTGRSFKISGASGAALHADVRFIEL
jgi:hypothetical protein